MYMNMLGLLIVLMLGIAGCSKTPEEQLANAQEQLAANDYPTAVITLKNLLQKDPDYADGRLLLAETSLSLGDPLSAEKEMARARDLGADAREHMNLHFRIMLALNKFAEMLELLAADEGSEGLTAAEASTFRGRALLGLGSAIEAQKSFVEALRLDATNPEARWGLAASYLAQGRNDEGANEIQLLVSQHPEFSMGWMLKGQNAIRQGKLAEAEAAFQRSVNASRATVDRLTEVSGLVGLAETQLNQDKTDAAEITIKSLASIAGPAPVTRFLVARLAYAQGDNDKAANELEELMNITPNNLAAMLLYGSVNLRQGNFAQAETVLSQVVARQPANLPARRMLAAAQYELSEPAAAVETLEPLLVSDSEDSRLSIFASQAMMRAGSADKAIELLERSLAGDPENPNVIMTLASAYLSAGRAADAIRLTESLPQDDEDFRRGLLLAMAYAAQNRGDEADVQIDAVMTQHAENIDALTIVGDFYLATGANDKARPYLESAISLQDDHVPARLALARLSIREGDPEGARSEYERVLAKEPGNLTALTSLANYYARSRDIAAAEKYLLRAIDADKRAALPKIMLAKLLLGGGDAIRAEGLAQEAARLDPDNAAIQAGAGDVLVSAGKYEEALSYLNKATELAPQSSRIWYSLARAQLALGDNANARSSLKKSLDINPNSIPVLAAMALLEASDGAPEKGIEIARKLQAQYPDNPTSYSLEAEIQMLEEEPAKAAALFVKAYDKSPSQRLARSAYRAGVAAGNDDAHLILEQWTDRNPDDTGALLLLAQHTDRSGDKAAAISQYEQAVKVSPDNVAALNNLAWLYNEVGDNRAESLARRAYELRPDIASIVDTLGWILVSNEKTAEGAKLLEQAAAVAPDNKTTQYHLAVALQKLGDPSRSADILRAILNDDRDFAERAAATSLLAELEK